MIINEYTVKIFETLITVVGFDIEDIAKSYPGADSITLSGTHVFIGDGSTAAQTLTKATPVPSAFTGSAGPTNGSSHIEVPTDADMSISKPSSIVFTGPTAGSAFTWEIDGFSLLHGRVASVSFETSGTYVVKLTCASDGGQTDPQYMKITVT